MWVSETATEEILTVAAGQLGAAHLAAQSALVTTVQIAFVIPAGLSTAASVRTANCIGSQDTRAAKFAAKVVRWPCSPGSLRMALTSTCSRLLY